MKDVRIAFITGASAGVGRAVVQRFARAGYHLGLMARDLERLEAAAKEIERYGGRALLIPGDTADATGMENAADRVEKELGPIDVWINNAMVSVFSPFMEMTMEEFRRVTEVTYLGFVYGTYAALKRMKPRDRGTIVQVGSALAYRGIPLQSAYCGAKHGVEGFMDSLRAELLHDKSHVHLTMVQLPAVNTPQFDWVRSRLPRRSQPVPPIYQPEVVAEAIYFAAHHRRRELYVGWPTVEAIVGNKLFPGLIDHYLARTGYDSQQTDEPRDPGTPDNLWQTVKGPWGSHGRFDARARNFSTQLWLSLHRGQVVQATLILAVLVASGLLISKAGAHSFF